MQWIDPGVPLGALLAVSGFALCLSAALFLFAHLSGQKHVHALAAAALLTGLLALPHAFAGYAGLANRLSFLFACLAPAAMALAGYLEMRALSRGTGLPRILVLAGAGIPLFFALFALILGGGLLFAGLAALLSGAVSGAGLFLMQRKRGKIEKPSETARGAQILFLFGALVLAVGGSGLLHTGVAVPVYAAALLAASAMAAAGSLSGGPGREAAVTTNRVLRLSAKSLEDENRQLSDMAARLEYEKSRLQQRRVELEKENRQAEDRIRELCQTADSFYTLGQSIDYARRIQQALTPSESKLRATLGESFVLNLPRDKVSGDFLWCQKFDDGWTMLCVADCTGHGVPGAFMSALGTMMLGQIVTERTIRRPDQVLFAMDRNLRSALSSNGKDVPDGMEAAILLLSPSRNQAIFCGARLGLFRAYKGQCEIVEGVRRAIGGRLKENAPAFDSVTIPLRRGEMLFLSSDGFQDQLGGPDEHRYLKNRFRDTLGWTSGLPVAEQRETLLKSHNQWKGPRTQTDDILVVGFQV